MPSSAASDLGLHCLHRSKKGTLGLCPKKGTLGLYGLKYDCIHKIYPTFQDIQKSYLDLK